MAINLFLILSCILGTTLTFHIDEGCEAKAEWETKITWPEFHIGSWTSTGNSEILKLKITFRGENEELTYDVIKLSRDRYEFIKMRALTKYSTFYNVSESVTDGWNKFIFRIDKKYTLMHVLADERHILVTQEVKQNVDGLIIKGSNITLNCPTDHLRMWNVVEESSSVVPLDTSENHNLSFYSGNPMSPSIGIGSREYSLGWNGHTITTLSSGKPLPPYQLHNISLTCSSASKLKCIIQTTNGNQLEDVPLSKLPDHVSVKRRSGDKFSVMLFGIQDYTSEPEVDTTTSNPKPDWTIATTTIAMLVVFLIIFILFAIGLSSLVCYIYKKWKVTNKQNNMEMGTQQEQTRLLESGSNFTKEGYQLLEAVRRNNPHQVKSLLQKITNPSDYDKALLEAHLLLRCDIIEIFENTTETLLEPLKPQNRETTICKVMQKYDERVKEVFEAAQNGQYHQGVGQLLFRYELPATIKDAQGRSLIHVIASTKDLDGAPLWSLQNLKNFVQNNSCYANAIDFRGKTCLHHLVEAVSNQNAFITWYNKDLKSEKAWSEMAEELIAFGCDPTIKDCDGILPYELAKEKRCLDLADYLQEKYESIENKRTRISKEFDFNAFINDAKEGIISSLMKKMNCLRELLPLHATKNPLTASIAGEHLEATLLLLSGGAWICGRSLVSITPLEVVHAQKTLPVIFLAIMRRECTSRLRFEMADRSKDEKFDELYHHIEKLTSNVEKGILTVYRRNESVSEKDRSEECRNLLCSAAKLGMPLTCQMLGLENVDLQPLPKEKKPSLEAIKNRKNEVLYVLYRDLQMSAFAHTDTEKLPESFRDEIWQTEFAQLKKACDSETLEKISTARNESQKISISKSVLSYVAKQGLVYTLHTIKDKVENFTISDIVDDVTGCTMLHIAAMYGRFSMIEYLLYDKKVDIMSTAKGGFTAAHLAAMKGNKECMQYLQVYMEVDYGRCDAVSDGGQTAHQLLKGYENLVKDFDFSFLSDDIGLETWCLLSAKKRAKVILEEKFNHNKISNTTGFREFVENYQAEYSVCDVVEEMRGLLNAVSEIDDRFEGDIAAYHSNAKGLKIPLESLQIYWEVKSKVFNDFKIRIHETELHQIDLEFASQDFGSIFSNCFYETVMKTTEKFSFKSSLIWHMYPAVTKESLGVNLLLAIYGNNRLRLVSVLLIPVLKTDYPEENRIEPLSVLIKDIEPTVYLAKKDNSWTYVIVKLEEDIMNQLQNERRLVLLGCKLLTRILYSCWWYPKFENRRHSIACNAHAFSISTLPDRVLTSLFLEEVSLIKDKDWERTEFLNRVIAIFRRAVEGNDGQPHPDSTVKLFLDFHYSTYKVNTIIPVIIEFLESLQQC